MKSLATPARKLCHLLKTGQTTQYGSKLDDGYYEIGIVKAYSVLSSGQYSGTTNITLNGKTDTHSNNCVVDLNTGLMWSRYVSASVGSNSDGRIPWTTNANGEGIFEYCAAANAASLAGYTDWRVPSIAELFSIADYEASDAIPDSTAFPSYPALQAWSATTAPSNTAYALTFFPTTGAMTATTKSTILICILVRGGM